MNQWATVNTFNITESIAATVGRRGRWAVALMALILVSAAFISSPDQAVAGVSHSSGYAPLTQAQSSEHQAVFTPGPPFNVGEVSYLAAHDFDTGTGTDTCLGISVPPGDTFTLSLVWEALFAGIPGAGDLDLYLYNDSACTASALLTSSFNSNAYTGELLEITPQVRNIGDVTAIAGIRIGRRAGKGNPGLITLSVLTGAARFVEHGTAGPPLQGPPGAPSFTFTGPFTIAENSLAGTMVGSVSATDPQSDVVTYFELEPAAGQTTFQINAVTGAISVEDPTALDREAADVLVYWIGATDGVAASVVSVGVSLNGTNDNTPVARSGSVTTLPGTPVEITLTATDADIDPAQQLELRTISPPGNGSLSQLSIIDAVSSVLIYSPDVGFTGIDTFSFEADDGLTVSAAAKMFITVTGQPPTPVPGDSTPTPVPTPVPTVPGGNSGGGSGGGGFVPPPLVPTTVPTSVAFPPSVPRFLRAEAEDTAVTINWQRPLSDGGAPIAGYRVFNINTAQSTIFEGDITSAKVFGLENGTGYLFQVRAFNTAGLGDAGLVGPVTPVSALLLTVDVQASLHPDDTVSVWWLPVQGPRVSPISVYRVWIEGGDPLVAVESGDPLITNVSDVEPDAWHSFRVTAFDEDGGIVASGVTEQIYLPPTLASMYEPLPADAILIDLTDEARTEMQEAFQSVAGSGVLLADGPMVLTIRDGDVRLFVEIDGLHRAIVLPPEFMVTSVQLTSGEAIDGAMPIELEIAEFLKVSGEERTQIDPTGVLFEISEVVLTFTADLPPGAAPVKQIEFEYGPGSLSPDSTFEASLPVELPTAFSDALVEPLADIVAAVIEIRRSGLIVAEPSSEHVRFVVETGWHESQLRIGGTVSVFRHGSDGIVVTEVADCAPLTQNGVLQIGLTSCEATFDGDGGSTAYYALVSGGGQQPDATPPPTPLAAPSDPPTPTPVSGPSLVVVENEPTATSVPAAAPSVFVPAPQATATAEPTPATPLLPESEGGGTSVVTWLMAGLLGLVVLRGAYYAVGRIRS